MSVASSLVLGCCCDEQPEGCLGCLAGSRLSEGACPQAPGDTLTLVVTRPTRQRSVQSFNCTTFGGCFGCASIKVQGGAPIKIRYSYEGRYWVFYPPQYCFDGDPTYPACQSGGAGNKCLQYIGCITGGQATSPFVVPPPPGCANGNQPCVKAPTLCIPPALPWNLANVRHDLPCDTPTEAKCCDPCPPSPPASCFACGMSLYQQRMAAQYPWAREILLYRCGQKPFGPIHNEAGQQVAQSSDLWQQFLGFAHAETHYLYDPTCVEIPAGVPMSGGTTAPPLSSIVPKLYIYACAGVPMFEFDFFDAAAEGIISQQQAIQAVQIMRRLFPLSFNLTQGEVQAWRDVMQAMESAGRLSTIDWRGKASEALMQAAGTIPQMAGCAVAPEALPELGPVRKHHYPALDPRQAVDTAQALQVPTCQGVVLLPSDPNYAAWAATQHMYFRCIPGGWTFAAWLFGPTDVPEDPRYVWYGRQIGKNVVPHSQIGGPNTDYAWNAMGIPNVVTCTPVPCSGEVPGFPCEEVNVCETCINLGQECDLVYGRAAYGSTCAMFVATWGKYIVGSLNGQQTCECETANAAYVVRSKVGCTFDASVVPWVFRETHGPSDAISKPSMPWPGTIAACSTCQGLNQGGVLFSPGGGPCEVLCPGHVCWSAANICGGWGYSCGAIFEPPTVSDPVCESGGVA